VLRKASGFVYFVSMTGIHRYQDVDTGDVRTMVENLRRSCTVCRSASASGSRRRPRRRWWPRTPMVVVGSALVRLIESKAAATTSSAVRRSSRELKDAVRQRGGADESRLAGS
jgi:tryptophan synthase alpha subunit